MTTEIYDLRKLKAFRQVKKDLEKLLPVVELAIKQFNNYKMYVCVSEILTVLTEQERLMKLQLEKINETVSTKGKIK